MFPKKLQIKLENREASNSLRKLSLPTNLIDFSSNDYLGFSTSLEIQQKATKLVEKSKPKNGATGSRLLSGNYPLYKKTERYLAQVHQSESALLFNSGYDANLGFFSSVPQKGDLIFYDEHIHASIRDGIQLSNAKAYKFKHNNLVDLDELNRRIQDNFHASNAIAPDIYVVTESVFSMDGDSPDLKALVDFCKQNKANLIVDEAHALGVFGFGLVQKFGLQNEVFARITTFGKGLGCHGAAILGSSQLKKYLVNFARSLIYTTALAPHSIATIFSAYEQLIDQSAYKNQEEESQIINLNNSISFFTSELKKVGLDKHFVESKSAIHSCIISGNKKVKSISEKLKEKGFDVKAILSPTVVKGQERLRFCLHSYNTEQEIQEVLNLLATFV